MKARYEISLGWLTGVGALVLLMMPGCSSTYGTQRASRQMAEREDMLIVREELRRLKGRVEDVALDNENLRTEWDDARRDTSRTVDDKLYSVENRLQQLEHRLDALEAAREKDKQEIIDTLSGTITKVIKKTAPASTAPRRKASSGYGYEHVVEAGQTLSAIAKAYGVTTRAIIDANDIEDPDRLRVGQVLFIPE